MHKICIKGPYIKNVQKNDMSPLCIFYVYFMDILWIYYVYSSFYRYFMYNLRFFFFYRAYYPKSDLQFPKLIYVDLGYGQIWGIECSKSDHVPNPPRSIWEFGVLGVPNLTTFQIGPSQIDLGGFGTWSDFGH